MPQTAQRMSRVDTAWLRMDNDVNLMMIVGVWLLQPGITYEALCERINDKLLKYHRFRQKVVQDAAGASWVDGTRRTSGPAVPVTATSGGRTVRGTVPKGGARFEGQKTRTLDLGGTSRACDRTWTLTYRPPNATPR